MNIEETLQQLTLEEKIGMIHGAELFRTKGVPRLGIPPLIMSDGPMGVRREFAGTSWAVPNLSDDYSTYLPCNTALAATWNRTLAYKSGQVLGQEARGRGKDVILAPGINIDRTPLCGRNYEYMTEDPYLAGEMAVPFIKGIEENDVAACVKHLVANNQETERMDVSVEMSERALREIYLPAFEKAVKEGKTKTIMGAYNRFRGVHCCQNSYLLKDILRDEWGFDGVVVSDWGGVHTTYETAMSGLDVEMNITATSDEYFFAAPLMEAVKEGKVPEAVIDEKVRHILELMERLNMFNGTRKSGGHNRVESRQKVLDVAREAIVLLKNDDKVLPFKEESLGKVAIIGDNAERLHADGGDSAQIKALYEISPLMGIKMRLGGNVDVTFARGYSACEEDRECLFNEAVTVAKEADTVIFVGGLNHVQDQEGHDRENMDLPYGQDALIKKLLEVNERTVVVMLSGSQVSMSEWIDEASTVLQTWYTGMEGGYALAEVLMGDVNPSGKLPITFPFKLSDWPAHKLGEFPGGTQVHYNEDIFVGYRYFTTVKAPVLFEFGYGLSYTTFAYSDLEVANDTTSEEFTVSFKLKNTGSCKGAEVAQLYIEREVNDTQTVRRVLKGFEKIVLAPGETQEVQIKLTAHDFEVYNEASKKWELDANTYGIAIGASVEDIRLLKNISLK